MIDLKDKFNYFRFSRQNLIKDRYSNMTTQDQAFQFFSNIYGLDGMKENIFRALISEKLVQIIMNELYLDNSSQYKNFIKKSHDVRAGCTVPVN